MMIKCINTIGVFMYTTKDKIADVCGAILVAFAFFVLYAAASAADLAIAGM